MALEVGFINATTPFWVLLLGLRMGGSAVTAGMWWGLACAFAGTLLIISKGQVNTLIHFHLNLGNLWSLLGAIAFAWFSIRVRGWTRSIDTLPLNVVTAWSGVIFVMLPAYLIWVACGQPWLVWNDSDLRFALAATSYISLGPTMLGNLFYLYGVSTKGPTRAAAFLYLSPLFSAAFSIGWLGERIAWFHVAGILAIFVGLAILGNSAPRLTHKRVPP